MKTTLALAAIALMLRSNALIAQAHPASAPAQLDQWIHDLDDPSPVVREAAVVSITELPAGDLPFLEAAAKKANLSAAGTAHLKSILDHDRQWLPARLRNRKTLEETFEWNRRTMLEAYDHVGHKDPRWDETVHKAIELFVAIGAGPDRAFPLIEEAIKAGCDDPLVKYLEVRDLERLPGVDPQMLNTAFGRAAQGLVDSNYPPYRKCNAAVHSVEFTLSRLKADADRLGHSVTMDAETNRVYQSVFHAAFDTWPAVCASDVPTSWLVNLADELTDRMAGTQHMNDEAFQCLFQPMEKALPNSSAALTAEGYFYIQYAWQARGGGWAKDVTPEGWRLFAERLAKADEVLNKAWQLDPTNRSAAIRMMTVALGRQQPRDVMGLWFKRAMEDDPDDSGGFACRSMIGYLEPRWYGTPADMLVFAHECYARENWASNLPFVLVSVHDELSGMAKDPDAYFQDPSVWSDIASVYEPYLRAHPGGASYRSRYAWYACRAGQWGIARQQFDQLGPNANASIFGGVEAMNRYKAQAEQQAPRDAH